MYMYSDMYMHPKWNLASLVPFLLPWSGHKESLTLSRFQTHVDM